MRGSSAHRFRVVIGVEPCRVAERFPAGAESVPVGDEFSADPDDLDGLAAAVRSWAAGVTTFAGPSGYLHLEVALLDLDSGGPGGAVVVAVADLDVSESAPAPVSAADAVAVWSTLADAGVRSWIIGGWGVDALVGRATRDHHDVDLFVLDEDAGRLLGVLRRPGSRIRYLWSENRWFRGCPTAFVADLGGIEVDVHTVGVADGLVTRRSAHTAELPRGSLQAVGLIGGHEVPCATAEAQRILHSGYALPEHHLRDLAALDALGTDSAR